MALVISLAASLVLVIGLIVLAFFPLHVSLVKSEYKPPHRRKKFKLRQSRDELPFDPYEYFGDEEL